MTSDSLTTAKIIDYFKKPKLFAPKTIFENKELIPDKKGIYGWYFNCSFENLFEKDSIDHLIYIQDNASSKSWILMYIGIAGRDSERTLRERIFENHLNGTSRNSTFRKTLASLLSDKLNLEPQNRLNGQDRGILNSWLFKYGRIAWVDCGDPESFENKILDQIGEILPLNIQENKNNPWRRKLKELRKPWKNK